MVTQATATDWQTIERDYRAGVKSLRQIAGEHGITHSAVANKARREEWTRDLSGRIAARTSELLGKAAVTGDVTTSGVEAEAKIVESNASLQASVVLRHRADAQRLSEKLARLAADMDSKEAKSLPLPQQAKAFKCIVDAHCSLVGVERQGYGITAEQRPDDGLAGLATAELLKLRARLANG